LRSEKNSIMTEQQEVIAKLAEGFSSQAKTANKFWITLIISSIIGLVGRPDNDKLIELPFTLGKVYAADFYSIIIVLISVVIIAFSSAMLQLIMTRILIQSVIDKLDENEKHFGKVHMHDFFDSIAIPTYSKVSPIAKALLGNFQFKNDPPTGIGLNIFTQFIYFIFRISMFAFYYIIPLWALSKCWNHKTLDLSKGTILIPNWILVIIMVLAAISISILFIEDIKHI
jgi:hypothetical protein